jgi:predicted metal-dependent hydrolase
LNTRALLEDFRRRDIRLQADGDRLLVDAPAEADTAELRAMLSQHKGDLLKVIRWEQRKLAEADRRGLMIKWSKTPGWITLHDPTTGEWHEVRARECLPGIVEAAKSHAQRLEDAPDGYFRDGTE